LFPERPENTSIAFPDKDQPAKARRSRMARRHFFQLKAGSRRSERPYLGVKVKNRSHQAFERVKASFDL